MGRLTEGSACFMFCAGEREELGEDCSFYEVCFERQMYDKLKHYEDLEEAGRLIDRDELIMSIADWQMTLSPANNEADVFEYNVLESVIEHIAKLKELEGEAKWVD